MKRRSAWTSKAPRRPGSKARRGRAVVTLFGIGTAALAMSAATAQRDESDREPTDCIPLMSIDRTEVVGDDTVLFFMQNDDVFRNTLDARCPGLRFDERFMYEVHTSQLCSSDFITVLTDVGFGFMSGASCGLGEFEPITESAADELRDSARRRD